MHTEYQIQHSSQNVSDQETTLKSMKLAEIMWSCQSCCEQAVTSQWNVAVSDLYEAQSEHMTEFIVLKKRLHISSFLKQSPVIRMCVTPTDTWGEWRDRERPRSQLLPEVCLSVNNTHTQTQTYDVCWDGMRPAGGTQNTVDWQWTTTHLFPHFSS